MSARKRRISCGAAGLAALSLVLSAVTPLAVAAGIPDTVTATDTVVTGDDVTTDDDAVAGEEQQPESPSIEEGSEPSIGDTAEEATEPEDAEPPLEEEEGPADGLEPDLEDNGTRADAAAFTSALPLPRGVTRAGGATRYDTAVALSKRLFPSGGADTVFVASGTSFADGLALGALASFKGGPLLLVSSTSVPSAVASEIRRLQPQEIVVAGGAGAISENAVATLASLAPNVRRVSGSNRYATAAAIAKEFPQGSGAMIATGTAFPDALVASAASSMNGGGGPVLLTRGFTASAEALQSLRILQPSQVTIVGGTWSSASLEQIQKASGKKPDLRRGSDRYATSAALAQKFWPTPSATVLYATGSTYADAMAAVPAARAYGAPILLTRTTCRPESVIAPASRQSAVLVVGGVGAIADGAVTNTCPALPSVVSQSGGYYRFGMTHRAQQTNYYCGPATAEMILSRIGYGRSKSGLALSQYNLGRQEFLKTNLDGRTLFEEARMSVGMNAWMGKSLYAQMWKPSSAQLRSKVSASFTSTGRPVVVDTQEWSGGAHYNGHPAYSTLSHLMPVEGYSPSSDQLIMLDSASHFYGASRPRFTHGLSNFTQFLQRYGIYY